MTPNLLPLYAASFALMAVLALFAFHNKKTGWVKHRPEPATTFRELVNMQRVPAAELTTKAPMEAIKPNAPVVALERPRAAKPHSEEVTEFTRQLCRLQTALHHTGQAVSPAQFENRERDLSAQPVPVRA